MEEAGAFDMDAFLDSITKEPEIRRDKWLNNIKLIKKRTIASDQIIHQYKQIKDELAAKNNELSVIRVDHRKLLEKVIPLEKQSEDNLAELTKYKEQNMQKETELEALSCHLNQLQALVKDLESKNEAMSVEKSLTEAPSTYIKHILLFGKIAERTKKLTKKRQALLDKYRQQLNGEDCESDKDEEMEIPPRCDSVDTGIGSSLTLSEDEKLWSPESQFSQSHTYQKSPASDSCDGDEKLSKKIIQTNDASTSPLRVANPEPEENVPKNRLVSNVATNTSPRKKVSVAVSPIKNENTNTENFLPMKISKESIRKCIEIATNTTPPKKIKLLSVATNTTKSPQNNNCASNLMEPLDKSSINLGITLLKDVEPVQKELDINIIGYNDTDVEIQKIFKEMSFGLHLKELSPIAPTPDIVLRALQRLESSPSVSKNNKLLDAPNPVPKSQRLIRKIQNLRLVNHKLRTRIKSQRVKLLNARKMLNNRSATNPLPRNEEELVKFLTLMSRVGSRFHIQEIRETYSKEKYHSVSSHKMRHSSSSRISKKHTAKRDHCPKVLESNIRESKTRRINKVKKNETSETQTQYNCSQPRNIDTEDTDDDVPIVRSAGMAAHKNVLFGSSDEETSPEDKEKSDVSTYRKVIDEDQRQKPRKKGKLSKLDKLKRKLTPKSKILTDDSIPPRKRCRKEPNHSTELSNETLPSDQNTLRTPTELNSKSAYEKAVQIMAELKAKQIPLKSPSETKMCSRVTRSSLKNTPFNEEPITVHKSPISENAVAPSNTRELRSRTISQQSKLSSPLGSVRTQAVLDKNKKPSVILTPISNNKSPRIAHTPQQVFHSTEESSIIPNAKPVAKRNFRSSGSEGELLIDTEIRNDELISKPSITVQAAVKPIKPVRIITSQKKEQAVKSKRVCHKMYVDLDSVQSIGKPESVNCLQNNSTCASNTVVQALPNSTDKDIRPINVDYADLNIFESGKEPACSRKLCTSNTIINHSETDKEALDKHADHSQSIQMSYSDLDMFSSEDNTDTINRNESSDVPGCTVQSNATKKQTEIDNATQNLAADTTADTPALINTLNTNKVLNCAKLTRCLRTNISSPLKGLTMTTETADANKTHCEDPTKNTSLNSSHSTKPVNNNFELKPLNIHEETSAQTDKISNNSIGQFFMNMLKKYGKNSPTLSILVPPTPEKIAKQLEDQLENSLGGIDTLLNQTERNLLVSRLETINYKHFIFGLMEFLMSDKRTKDILCRVYTPPLPPMTKTEQVLLNVLSELQNKWPSIDLFNEILKNIEYKLFRLNHTPPLLQVENLAHFYAVLCRFRKQLNRLRVFIVDAMYCMSFKALPLIRQVIDVWMHVLPRLKLRSANNLLVFTITYLLHYCRCEEYGASQNLDMIRKVLIKRYNYNMTEWCERTMLEKIREAIFQLKGTGRLENKLVATSFILIAKRSGVKWCQKNIIDGMLMPIIKCKTTKDHIKAFCISLLGPLMRPYPNNMKLHCEIAVNHLLLVMEQNPSHAVQQSILISLILLRRHNRLRSMEVLVSWTPKADISPELENQLRFLIEEKPLKMWKKSLCDVTRSY